MKYEEKYHHITALMPLPVFEHSTQPERPPLPVAQIYDLTTRAKPVAKPAPRAKSMFAKSKSKDIEDDLFLQRLSRLN